MPTKLVADRWRTAPIILAVFAADIVVALILKVLPPLPRFVTTVLDAVLLSALAAPFIWRIVAGQIARAAGLERLRADARVGNVLSTASDGIITTDARGVVQYFNVGAEKIFGHTAGEVIGRNIGMLIPVNARAAHEGHVARIAGGPDWSRPMGAVSTIMGRRKSGDTFPADVSISKLVVDGEVTLTAIVRDVTERRQAEAAVREAESRLRTVVNSAPITIWATDAAGIFTLSDGSALAGAGLKAGDNVGLSAIDLYGDMPFTFHDGTATTGREVFGRALSGETVVALSKLGGTVFETHLTPQYGAQGAVVGVVGVATDITERVAARSAERRSEERFRTIFDRSPLGVALTDSLTGRFLAVNPQYARIAGRPIDALTGLDWMSITHPDDVPRDHDKIALLNAGKLSEHQMEKRYLKPDGATVWVKLTVTLMPVEGDAPSHHLAMVEDITERKSTDEVLRQNTDRLKSLAIQLLDTQETERRLLALELHDEIGQVLTAAKINLQSLQRYPDPASFAPRLADSVRIVERTLQQVRSLSLSLRPPLLDDLGLAAALRWLADESARRMGAPVEFRDGVGESRFDAAIEIAAFRIVQEALNNVAKHSGARSVEVELQVQHGDLHVRVRDDGAGFDVAAAHHRAIGGASLGLLGMEKRATAVGGGIAWRPVPGQQGTEVHAWLPLNRTADTVPDGSAPG